jgi:hypothetical protein
MNIEIGAFVNILLNLIWAYVFGNQSDVDYWSGELRAWWRDFNLSLQIWVYEIRDAINDELRSWENWLSAWADWVEDQFDYVAGWIDQRWIDAQNFAIDQANKVIALLNQAIAQVNAGIAAVESWIGGWLNNWIIPNVNWLLAQVIWLLNYVTNTVIYWINWLLKYYHPIEWYVNQAMSYLHAFLLDPVGFVLGLLLPSVRYWYDIYTVYKDAVSDFVNLVLVDLVNLYNLYTLQVKAFLRDPRAWIVANVEDVLVTWVFRVLAERW